MAENNLTSGPGEQDFADLALLETFLARRLRLATMRRAADKLAVSDEVRESLDESLAETEEVTRALLTRTKLPDAAPMDDLFDDEFLLLCLELRIELVAWINQPAVLIRLEDPDAILRRYANLANAYDIDAAGKDASTDFAQAVTEMERKLRETFDVLKRNRAL